MDANEIIETFKLKPHIEGGFYKETYRAAGIIKEANRENRNYSTAIYFLLPTNTKSKLHRLKYDEVWHFYLGGPMTLVQIHENGKIEKITLGPNIKSGHKLQHVVPAGCWFGGFPETDYSFVGCTLAPGFDFNDFELATRHELIKQFPHAKDIIEKLTTE